MYNTYFNLCLHIIGPWELVSGGDDLLSGGNEIIVVQTR